MLIMPQTFCTHFRTTVPCVLPAKSPRDGKYNHSSATLSFFHGMCISMQILPVKFASWSAVMLKSRATKPPERQLSDATCTLPKWIPVLRLEHADRANDGSRYGRLRWGRHGGNALERPFLNREIDPVEMLALSLRLRTTHPAFTGHFLEVVRSSRSLQVSGFLQTSPGRWCATCCLQYRLR